MKARQLPSGAWNCRIMVEGQTYSFTDGDKKTVTFDCVYISGAAADYNSFKLVLSDEQLFDDGPGESSYIGAFEQGLSEPFLAG